MDPNEDETVPRPGYPAEPTSAAALRVHPGAGRSLYRRRLFLVALVASLALSAVMAGPLLVGRIQVRDDLGAFHLPMRWLYAQRLAAGEAFDWAPELFCGFYATGEGQVGGYHPVHWLLFRTLPFATAAGLSFYVGYPFMLAGSYLFFRRFLQRRDAAMFGGLVFTFSSFNMLHFVHPNAVAIVAHIPWLLWAIHVVMVESNRRRVVAAEVAIAVLTGSQLLLAYPQYVLFSLLAEAAYAVFLGITRRYQARDGCAERGTCGECADCAPLAWLRLLVAKGLGVALGGVQFLPTLDLLQHSSRSGAGAAFADTGSLHPANLVQWVAPYACKYRVLGTNTHELGAYLGMVPLVLIVWLLVRPGRLGSWRPRFGALMLFGLIVLALAFGRFTPLYAIQKSLPLVGMFRCPCRYMVLVQLAAAGLAAIGFGALVRDCLAKQPVAWRRFFALWLVLALSVMVSVLAVLSRLREHPLAASLELILAGPALCAAAVLLLVAAARGKRWALPGLILLTAVDLGIYGFSYAVYGPTPTWKEYVAAIPEPPGQSGNRVMVDAKQFGEPGRRAGNQIVVAGWRRTWGYAGLYPEKLLDYRRFNALRVAGVHWVWRGAFQTPPEGLVAHDPRWLKLPEPLPRARLVTEVVVSRDPGGQIAQLPVESAVILDHDLALPHGEPGSAELTVDRPGLIGVRVECDTPQLLVVSESYSRGWQVEVEHQPKTVWRVNGDFLGCLVGPGKQHVVFRFDPKSRRDGRVLSIVGLVLLGCVATVRLVLSPRKR